MSLSDGRTSEILPENSHRLRASGGAVGRARAADKSQWPDEGPVRAWFEYLSDIRARHGMPTGQAVAARMHLKARSRISALLRYALPDGQEQAVALLDALGAASYEKEYALRLYRTIRSIPPDDPAALPRRTRGGLDARRDKEARLGLRVHRAVFPLPYIHRDVEGEVGRYLEEGRPVLLIGPSMVGKTRMAAMLITEVFAEREWQAPETKEALAALGAAHSKMKDTVIFLDDIDRLLGAGGISQGEFRSLARRNAIVGTIKDFEYDGYLPTSQLRAPEWDALSMFSPVFLARDLSPAEQDRLRDAVDDAELTNRIIHTGIGEYVGAAEYIAAALHTGLSASPAGHALVLGAADWARAGIRTPVPDRLLRHLAMPHIGARHRGRLLDTRGYEDAMEWAIREINPTVSLLQPEEHDCFSIFDYALDLIVAQGNPIPAATWPLIIENAGPADLVNIGRVALRDGLPGIAEQAWRAAEGTNDPESAAYAAMKLGDLFSEQDETADAQAAYERAMHLWDTQAGPVAAVGLGNLLKRLGQTDGARAAYLKAIGSSHWWAAPAAAVNLGNLHNAQGDTAGAEQAYQQAIDADLDIDQIKASIKRTYDEQGIPAVVEVIDVRRFRPDPEVRAIAALKLGQLQAARQDLDAARDSFQLAARIGPAEVAVHALFSLGNLFRISGDLAGAQDAYKRVIELGDADIAPKAAVNLGIVLYEQGHLDGARAAFQQAVDSGHPEAAGSASLSLGGLLERSGDTEDARNAYQRAARCPIREVADLARRCLTELS